MATAIVFALIVVTCGCVITRALGLSKGLVGLGLAPAAGLTSLVALTTWSVDLGAPPPVPGAIVAALTILGAVVVVRDRLAISDATRTLWREQRVAVTLALAALTVPCVVMSFAFADAQVPLSPHDGAYHAAVIQAHRLGQPWGDWYPQGMAALFAATLQLMPWLDSAQGAMQLGMALPLLAVLSVLGLGVAVWRDLRIAAAAALLLGFTYDFPYFPQLWSGWPMATSLILVIGVWQLALEYLARPSMRWALLAGLLLGAILLVHGTELYTLVIILPIVLLSGIKRVHWSALARHATMAAALAVVVAAPYLPTLLHWAGTGGAYAVGIEDAQVPSAAASAGPEPFVVFALGALGVDLPIRLGLLAVGAAWAIYARRGVAVGVVGAAFALIAILFSQHSDVPGVRQLYAAVFPWGMHYRLFMLVAIAQALLAGAGAVLLFGWLDTRFGQPSAASRRLRRSARLLVLTWLGLMTWAMTLFLAYPAGLVLGFTSDDAAAMAWLRVHGAPGEVLANDGYADGATWAPYKAGMPVLLPRTLSDQTDLERRELVLDNIDRLDATPEAARSACALHVAYLYRGARASEWDARRFPSPAVLSASPALEQVFRQGEAIVYRTRLNCR